MFVWHYYTIDIPEVSINFLFLILVYVSKTQTMYLIRHSTACICPLILIMHEGAFTLAFISRYEIYKFSALVQV